jgi:hypothetical protein
MAGPIKNSNANQIIQQPQPINPPSAPPNEMREVKIQKVGTSLVSGADNQSYVSHSAPIGDPVTLEIPADFDLSDYHDVFGHDIDNASDIPNDIDVIQVRKEEWGIIEALQQKLVLAASEPAEEAKLNASSSLEHKEESTIVQSDIEPANELWLEPEFTATHLDDESLDEFELMDLEAAAAEDAKLAEILASDWNVAIPKIFGYFNEEIMNKFLEMERVPNLLSEHEDKQQIEKAIKLHKHVQDSLDTLTSLLGFTKVEEEDFVYIKAPNSKYSIESELSKMGLMCGDLQDLHNILSNMTRFSNDNFVKRFDLRNTDPEFAIHICEFVQEFIITLIDEVPMQIRGDLKPTPLQNLLNVFGPHHKRDYLPLNENAVDDKSDVDE